MAKAMVRQKEGIVKPQVVAGREFKGTAFISKPDKIFFKVSFSLITNTFSYRISQSEKHTPRQCFSPMFRSPLTHSSFYLWMTKSRISSILSIHLQAVCLLVSRQTSQSHSHLKSTKTSTAFSLF
jgi:hypothetical protein